MRVEKSYKGELMTKGTENEDIILKWLKENSKSILDFRDFKLAQRIDVDFGIETIDGKIVLAEIKSDKWINENANLFFETYRINHYVKDKWFYLGWGWRSPAEMLIVRNPQTQKLFIFNFLELRTFIGNYIAKKGKQIKQIIIETDVQKTTFGYLIPLQEIKNFESYDL